MPDGAQAPSRFRLFSRAELAALPEVRWLMEGVLEERGLSVLYGESNIGKTFVVLSIAASISLGMPAFAHACEKGQVVLFAGEGEFGIHSRLAAWDAYFQAHASDVFAFTGRPALSQPNEAASACTIIERAGIKPRLIVVDTLSTHFTGENENDAKDMTLFLEGARTVSERFGCNVLVVHHPKKNSDEPRGSGTVYNNVDTVAYLAKNEMGQLILGCRKQRNGPLFADIVIDLVERPATRDGEELSSLVAVTGAEIQLSVGSSSGLSKHQKTVLGLLIGGEKRRGELRDQGGIPEGSIDSVLDELKKRGLIEKAGAQRRDPYRLTEAGQSIVIGNP